MDEDRQLIEFLKELGKFKTIERNCRTLSNRQESDAEHSWHLAMMILLLKDRIEKLGYDYHKMLEFSFIHDLPEIYTGDFLPFRIDHDKKQKLEEEALERIYSILPKESYDYTKKLLSSYHTQESKEALLVRALDKLLPLISNIETMRVNNYSPYKVLEMGEKEVREYHKKFENEPIYKELFQLLFNECRVKKLFHEKE